MTSLLKGILSNFVSKVLVALLGLLTVVLVSRYLGPEGRGEIGLFMSTVALVQLFCDFGNSSAIINLSYRHAQKVLWKSSLIWVVGVCAISLPVLLLFSHLPFRFLIPPAAFLYSMVNLHHLLLMGNREVHKRNSSLLVVPVVLMLGFFLLSQVIGFQTYNYIIALFAALLISGYVSYGMVKPQLKEGEDTFVFETEILKKGFWAQSAQAVQFLNYRLNFFLVAYFVGEAALGIYNNAVIVCEAVWIIGHSMAQMQHMKILNTVGESNHYKITYRFMGLNFLATAAAILLLIELGRLDLWVLIFGQDFKEMQLLIFMLSPGVLAFSISNILNHSLHASDRFKTILICNVSGLIAGSMVAICLIPFADTLGAAISWSAGLTVAMLAYLVMYFKINRGHYPKYHLFSLISSALAAFVICFLSIPLIPSLGNSMNFLEIYTFCARLVEISLLFIVSFMGLFYLLNYIISKKLKNNPDKQVL